MSAKASSNMESAFITHLRKPKRIQRKRVRGWRMPENTVYVGRPTRWGNPYTVAEYGFTCLPTYREWLEKKLAENPTFLDPLKGKDLACWCPLDKPCHVDILLEFLGVQK